MYFAATRRLIAHASPVLVAQLASIGMMVVDTAVLGHFGTVDLAAVAIGGGIYVSIVFALAGIVQSVAPLAAHLLGAERHDEVGGILRQGFWLALLLSFPGVAALLNPEPLLALAPMEPAVALRVREYLGLLAWGLPAALFYRTFYAFSNALGQARLLMLIGIAGLVLHGVLAWGLGLQGWSGVPLGALGCGISNMIVSWFDCLSALLVLLMSPLGRRYRPFSRWEGPRWPVWRELLRLGIPMGIANFVEITAFTLVALLIAPLGATAVAGHRIIANLAALCYMLPLALAIATLSAVGQAVGARDWRQAHINTVAGIVLSAGLSTLTGFFLWLAAEPLVAAYTDDPAVRKVAVSLVIYIAVYQFFDALQTVAGHVLRAYRVTFVPMLVQLLAFWGIGLGLGWWLCFRWSPPLGVAGFWIASVVSLIAAAILLGGLLWKVIREVES
ncbi:MAG: MATE family efflux transporter [Betaproteobacteria bacterium]